MHRSSTRRAFTLVELIVVVVILGILAGIGLVSYQQVTKRAQDKSVESTVTTLAKEAQALAAYRADGVFTPDDLNKAVGDLPTLVDGAPGAAAWDVKTAPYAFVTAYGQLHVRLADDGTAAGVAAMSLSGNCLLARFTPTGRPTARFVGAVGASCSGDTALAAAPDAPIDWTDPTTAGPPARPTGLADTVTAAGIVLAWTPNTEPDLAGYRITVDGVAHPELLTVPGATIPAVPGEHTVTVVAVDKSALASDPSAPLLAAVPPAEPTQVTATVVHGVVTVAWTAAPGATSYRIWHQIGTSPATILGQVAAPTTTLTDGNLPAGASVTYSVAAANRGGESAATVADGALTAPTAAPTAVTAAASGTSITVAWTAPASATGFRVYRDGTAIWTGTAGSFTDAGLAEGTAHSYVVTATNAGGESAPSAAASATTVPGTPAGLAAAAGDGSIDLTWQPAPAAAGYRVYRSADGATFTLLGQATSTAFTDTSLVNGTHYWYAVAAFNGAGESGQSTAASSTPLPPVPAIPAGVTTTVTGTTVTISWAPVDRADGYRVYKNGTLLAQVTGGTSATASMAAGTSATFTVAAYNLAGESAQSAAAPATAAPSAPTGVTASMAAATTVGVSWTAPLGATGFGVYRDGEATPAWTGTGTNWTDTGLSAGTTHTYVVTATGAGGESPASTTATVTLTPIAPAGLAATVGDNSTTLAWQASAGATGYRVYRAADNAGAAGTFTLLGQATGTGYTDATAVNGTTYWYAVAAFNAGGESGQSTAVSSRPLPPVPATPSGVTTSVTGTTVTISWTAVSRADGYRVYKDGTMIGQVTPGSTTSATDTLPAGSTTSYTVSAYNIAGESGRSGTAAAAAKTTAPTAVTASASGTTITVAWTAPTGATGFTVYRDGAAAWTGTATSWADAGLATGATHSYVVTATSAAGESPASAPVSATTVPATPAGLTATAGDNTVALSWSATTGATGYRLYRSVDGTTFTLLGQASGTSASDATAGNGTSYWYAVSAFNGGGESGESTAATTKPLPPVPAVPSGVSTSTAGTTVTVSWSPVARADGYRVYKNGAYNAQVSGATSATDTLSVGMSATYSVSAYNIAGESAQSGTAAATATATAPTGVTATSGTAGPGGTTITVAWTAPANATGFKVYRDGAATAAWTGTGTSWADSGLAAGTTHSYTVTATNGAGESAPSASATATLVPAVPVGLKVGSVSATPVVLTWNASPGATSYWVYRDGVSLATGLTTTSYTDSTATAGVGYTYAVEAYDAAGGSGRTSTVTAVPTSTYAQAVLADSPIGYWRMDSSALRDLSGSGRTASTTGTLTWNVPGAVPVQTNKAVGTAAGSALLPVGTAITGDVVTTEFWMRPDNTNGMPISVGPNLDLYYAGGMFGFNTGNGDIRGVSSAGMQGRWVHVVAEFHGSAPLADKLWIDGQPQTLTTNGSSAYARPLGSTVQVSGWADGNSTYQFTGAVDDVSVYNGVLTDGQVAAHFAAAGTAYAATVAKSAPTAYYRLGDTGTVAADASGNGRDGTWSAGISSGYAGATVDGNTAALAQGTTGQVLAPVGGALGSAPVATVELWVKPTTNAYMMPVSFGGPGKIYDLFWNTGGWFGFNTGNGDNYSVASSNLPLNTWTHVVAEFHAGAPYSNRLWINGKLMTLTQSGTAATTSAVLTDLTIGRSSDTSQTTAANRYPWQGGIDEVAVYPRALTQAEITAHAAAR